MQTLERLRDLRNLNFLLFGGLPEQEFYGRTGRRYPVEETVGEITRHVEFDLETGEIKSYNHVEAKSK